ncbi:MAG: gluconokinase [Chloroflexota bacterium]|nr:gluconokinase [Chloroflexota bacterium]
MPSTVPLAAAEAPLVLALDLGTSSLRALLFDRWGRAVQGSEEQHAHRIRTTVDGGAETDPVPLFDLLVRCIDGALARAGDRVGEIAAVGTSCFWHSLVGVDANGDPVTPLLLWADTRSAPHAAALRATFAGDVIHERTGCPFHSSFWPAKLRWLSHTSPDAVARVARWQGFSEYIGARLAGESGDAISVSMASATGLLDVHRQAWDRTVLKAVGVAPEGVPPLTDRTEPWTSLRPAFSDRWPVLAGVPWYPAVGDGACANIGSGAVGPERIALTLGTSGAMRIVRAAQDVPVPPDIWAYRVDRDRFVLGGALSNGGNLLAWLGKLLGVGYGDETTKLAAALPPDAHGLTVLPFLAGERSPAWHDRSAGVVAGLTLATGPEALLRAGMEAVAYRFAAIYDRLCPLAEREHAIVANGGAILRSPLWLQIVADTLGHDLLTLDPEAEASARGAALLALEAVGALPDLAAAPDPAEGGAVYRPDPDRHARYQKGRERQRKLEGLLYSPTGAWDVQ